ncbi:MAG TPA: 30S ribosomal protein S27ae [Candidatus Bathyarchaeia archaeon]|nr:30S ribosomal protein S27ae [Candidatus Bathyarchaeia archaeon]
MIATRSIRMSQAQAQQPKQKQKKLRMRSSLYDVSGAAAKLKNRKCPRCGSVMASHTKPVQRWVCGSCSLTDYGSK